MSSSFMMHYLHQEAVYAFGQERETRKPHRRIFGFSARWVRNLASDLALKVEQLKNAYQTIEDQDRILEQLRDEVAKLQAMVPQPEPADTFQNQSLQNQYAFPSLESLVTAAEKIPGQQLLVIGKSVDQLQVAQDEITKRLTKAPAAAKYLYLRLQNGTEIRFLSVYSIKRHLAIRGLKAHGFHAYNLPGLPDAVWEEVQPTLLRAEAQPR